MLSLDIMIKNIKLVLHNKNYYLIFLIVISLFFWNSGLNYFGTNDDFAILLDISEGSEAPFISYFLSRFFTFLYQLKGSINWYPLILLVLQSFSIGVIFKSLLIHTSNRCLKIFFFLISIYFLISLSYNSAAILLSIAAYALFQNLKLFFCALLLVLGSFFRPELAIISSFFCTVHCFFFFRSKLRNWVAILLIIHSAIFGLNFFAKTLYSKSFAEFQDFNTIRGQLHGFPVLNSISDSDLLKIGWTHDDLFLFKNWQFYDERKFNTATLTKLTQLTSPLERVLSSLKSFSWKTTKYNIPLVTIFFLYIFLIPSFFNRKKELGFILANLFLFAFLEVFLRAPSRLVIPLNLLFILFIIRQIQSLHSRFVAHLYMCLLVVLALHIKTLYNVRAVNQINSKTLLTSREILAQNKEHIFLNFEKIHIDTPLVSWVNDPTNSIVPYGWPIFSPRYYKILRHKNFDTFKRNVLRNTIKAGVLVNPKNSFKNMKFLNYYFPSSEGFCYLDMLDYYTIYKCKI